MEFLIDLFGRFHPLIVHLPIGFLLMGLMMMVYDRRANKHIKIIHFTFFWGSCATLLAVFSGVVQYVREGYSWEAVKDHLIMGVLTFIVSFLLYLKLRGFNFLNRFSKSFLAYGLLITLIFTGHLGGNLTHGKDHLTEPLPVGVKTVLCLQLLPKKLILAPDSYDQLSLYSGVVQVILDQKCVSCHNPKKSKGGLLLHNYKGILTGGEGGPIISKTRAEDSEMIKRILLPKNKKKHMPPKAKTQLSTAEVRLLEEWIAKGAPENTTIAALGLKRNMFATFFPKDETGIFPDLKLPALSSSVMDSLRSFGLLVAPLYKKSTLLKISALNVPKFDDEMSVFLLKAKNHIVDLDLGHTQVTDGIFEVLKELKNLTILKLDNTKVKGKGIGRVKSLKNLKEINLVNTTISRAVADTLSSFSYLQKVYLYGAIDPKHTLEINNRSDITFEMGNYILETFDP